MHTIGSIGLLQVLPALLHACPKLQSHTISDNMLRMHLAVQAAFLIPIGIILYTVAGGLKATFLSSYIHTVIIYVVLCLFAFLVYTPSHVEQLGSPAKVC